MAGCKRRRIAAFGTVLVLGGTTVAAAQSGGPAPAPSSAPAEAKVPRTAGGDPPEFEAPSPGLRDLLDGPVLKDRNAGASPAEREASAEKYEDLTTAGALAIARSQFRDEFTAPVRDAQDIDGVDVLELRGENVALVKDERTGARRLVLSSDPLQVKRSSGMTAVDLELRSSGDDFVPRSPSVLMRVEDDVETGVNFTAKGFSIGLESPRDPEPIESSDRVFYANARTDADFAITPRPYGAELLVQVRSEQAPEEYRLNVDLPDGARLRETEVKNPIPEDEGRPGVQIVKGDTILGAIHPPLSYDAEGRFVPSSMRIDGDQVVLRVDHRGRDIRYPVLLDPEAAAANVRQSGTPGQPSSWKGWQLSTSPATAGTYPYFGYALGDPAYGAGGMYFTMPNNKTYKNYDYGKLKWTAPPGTYLTGFGAANASHAPFQSRVMYGIAQPDDLYDSRVRFVYRASDGNRNTTYPNPLGPAANAFSGAYTDFCYSTTVNTSCSTSMGDEGNSAQVLLQAYNPSGSTVSTGGNRAIVQIAGADLFIGDRRAPKLTSSTPADIGWVNETADTDHKATFTGTDEGLGLKDVAVTGAASVSGTTFAAVVNPSYPNDPPAAGACTGHPYVSRCPTASTSREVTYRVAEGENSLSATLRDAADNPSTTAKWTVRVDRSAPTAAKIDSPPTKVTAATTLKLTGSDAYSGVASAQLLVDGQPFGNAQPVTTPKAGDWAGTIAFDPAAAKAGLRSVAVRLTDQVGLTKTSDAVSIRVVDSSAPAILVTGGLRSSPLSTGRSLRITGTDKSPGVNRITLTREKLSDAGASTGMAMQVLEEKAAGCPSACPESLPAAYTLPDSTEPGRYRFVASVFEDDPDSPGVTDTWDVQVLAARDVNRKRLGMEQWFELDDTDTGAGASLHVNGQTGNAVWHDIPIVNPGRGLASVVNLTYNSFDRGGLLGGLIGKLPVISTGGAEDGDDALGVDLLGTSYRQAGVGFSIAVSGPNRVNEPLGGVTVGAFTQTNQAVPAGLPGSGELQPRIVLTDADGTRHDFQWEPPANGSPGRWTTPAGVNMRLRYTGDANPTGALLGGASVSTLEADAWWELTRPDGVKHIYDRFGYLQATRDRNDNTIDYVYESINQLTGGTCEGSPIGKALQVVAGTVLCVPRLAYVVHYPAGRTSGGASQVSLATTKIQIKYGQAPTVTDNLNSIGTFLNQLLGSTLASVQAPPIIGAITGRQAQISEIVDNAGRRYTFTYSTDATDPAKAGYLTQFTEAAGTPDERSTFFEYEDPSVVAGKLGDVRQLTAIRTGSATNASKTQIAYGSPLARPGITGLGVQPRPVHTVVKRGGGVKNYLYTPAAPGQSATHDVYEQTLDQRYLHRRSTLQTGLDARRPVKVVETDATRTVAATANGAVVTPVASQFTDDTTLGATTTELAWSTDNKVQKLTEPGRVTELKYEGPQPGLPASGTLQERKITTGRTHTWNMEYRSPAGDPFVRDLTAVIEPGNRRWTYTVGDTGNVTEAIDPTLAKKTFHYTTGGLVDYEISETGDRTDYSGFDSRTGDPTVVTGPLVRTGRPRTSWYRYDRTGNLVAARDARGTAPTSTSLEDEAALGTTASPAAYTTYLQYDAFDRPTGENVARCSASYCDAGDGPSRISRTTMYSRDNNVETETDYDGKTTDPDYDADGVLRSVTQPGQAEVIDGPSSETVTRFVNDKAQRLVGQFGPRATNPDIAAVLTTQQAACADGSGRQSYLTRYCLDYRDLPVAQIAYGDGGADGRPSGAADRLTTVFGYDGRGNRGAVIDPRRAGTVSVAQAVAAARAAAEAPADDPGSATPRPRMTTVFDERDRPTIMREYPTEDGEKVRKTERVYEADGDLEKVTVTGETDNPGTVDRERDADTRETKFGYDAMGRMLEQTDPLGRKTCWARRADGQVVATTTPRGADLTTSACNNQTTASGAYTTQLRYDEAGDLYEKTIPFRPGQYRAADGDPRADVAQWKVTYLRDAVGNPVGVVDGRASTGLRQDVKTQYTGAGQPAAHPHVIRNTFLDTGQLRSTTRPSWWDIDWPGAQPNPDPGDRYPGSDAADVMVGQGGPQIVEHQGPQTSNAARSQNLPDKPQSLGKTDFGEVSTQDPEWLPRAGLTHFRYHANGWLDQISDATLTDARRRTISYYPSGLPRKSTWPLQGTSKINHRFAYNPAGSLAAVNEDIAAGDDVTTTYTYDGWERRLTETAPGAANTAGGPSPRELTRFVYDDNDNLTTRRTPRPDPDNAAARLSFDFKYTSLDELRQEINPLGQDWEYAYDRIGQRTIETAPGQNDPDRDDDIFRTTSVYDRAGQLTHTISQVEKPGDQPGQTAGKRTITAQFGYDRDGNRTHTLTPGSSRTADPDSLTKRLSRTDYDARGLPWRTSSGKAPSDTSDLAATSPVDDVGSSGPKPQQTAKVRSSITEFDANGNLRRTITPRGITTADLPSTIDDGTDEPANLNSATENAQINRFSDEDLRTQERLAWDNKRGPTGALLTPAQPEARYSRTIEYDNGNTDPDGRVGWPTAIGLPVPVSAETAAKTQYGYNDQGWVTSISESRLVDADAEGQKAVQKVQIGYDDRGHQSSWVTKNAGDNDKGRDLRWTYYPNGLLQTRSATKTVRYDSNGNGAIDTADQTRDETRTYDYGYNPNRSLVYVRDRDSSAVSTGSQGHVTTISRDNAERERLIDETWSTGNDVALSYNPHTGMPESRYTTGVLNAQGTLTGADTKRTQFWMDSLGREMFTRVTPASGDARTTRTIWSDSGEMLQRRKSNGTTDKWSWTALGDKIRHDRVPPNNAETTTTLYTYDAAGQRTQDERGTHVFNARDQLTWWTRGEQRPDRAGWVTAYLPDATGQVWWRGEWTDAAKAQAGVAKLPSVESMLIDRTKIPANLKNSPDDTSERGIDPDARADAKTLELQRFNGERLMSSETLDRTEDAEGQFASRYLYDDSGNVQRIYVTDRSKVPTTPPTPRTFPFSPDDCEKDDLTQADDAKTTTRYCYDEFNRLIAASGANTGLPELITYDGLDRRDSKLTRKSGDRTVRRDYSYLGSTELLVDEKVTVTGDPAAGDDEDHIKRQDYDYDSAGSSLGQHTLKDTAAGERYRTYDKDANGSVTGLEQANGAIGSEDDYVYDPYGALDHKVPAVPAGQQPDPDPGLSSEAHNQPFRFEGFYYDAGIKTYDMHARHYRPDARRFLSRDQYASGAGDQTLQADPLTQNRYAFAGGNPVTNIEFDGHEPVSSFQNDAMYCGNNCRGGETNPAKQVQAIRRNQDRGQVAEQHSRTLNDAAAERQRRTENEQPERRTSIVNRLKAKVGLDDPIKTFVVDPAKAAYQVVSDPDKLDCALFNSRGCSLSQHFSFLGSLAAVAPFAGLEGRGLGLGARALERFGLAAARRDLSLGAAKVEGEGASALPRLAGGSHGAMFDEAGIEMSDHFIQRLGQRTSRLSESDALDAYRNGRLYYDSKYGSYIRYSSRTKVAVATDAPTGGKALSVFEGNPAPRWNPIRYRPGQ